MKIFKHKPASLIFLLCIVAICPGAEMFGQPVIFGKATVSMFPGSARSEKISSLKWINVNTDPGTWKVKNGILICTGQPVGVMRSEKQYENFMLHVEWMHLQAGGNSGMFVWSNATPPAGQRLPDGVEVQMLELDWVNQNIKNGITPPDAYVHGELFGVGGVKTLPDNPRGTRSKAVENRCKGIGEWNTYDVICVDGTVKLSVNGKFVNGLSKSTQKKGYICLESEGGEIHFRNLMITELAPGVTSPEQTVADPDKPDPMPEPLALHPDNPHYFIFRGKPALLIGSTEHYGAVMNLDFDYIKYLDELKASGMNITRTFTGIYVEPDGAFRIKGNTMAPAAGRFICPWSRSNEPGYANGGNKFDLLSWDEKYFSRLKDFIAEAGKRDIIVELDLFSNYYDTVQWKLSPLYFRNNVNNTGKITGWKDVNSMKNTDIIGVQERMVRKIIGELKDFDNLYYEVCNEPYFGDTTALREWEQYMTGIVAGAERNFRYRHLISNNIANHKRLVKAPLPGVSVYNFHYASPPLTAGMNYHLNSVIGDNETGFAGTDDAPYRKEAWEFMMAGGALYNNLDYSFTAGNEDGTFEFPATQPGGGGKNLRKQLSVLKNFMNRLDYLSMSPVSGTVRLPGGTGQPVYALRGNDGTVAFYSKQDGSVQASVEINLAAGSYVITLTDPLTGSERVINVTEHPGGWQKVSADAGNTEFAAIVRKSKY